MSMTNGNIKKTLFRFALPMILSLITQQLYNVVDMIIVGRYLGVNELAAVGNAGIIVQILVTLSGGLEMGSEVIFARYLGAKKYKDILVGVKSILLFGLISGLCITVLGILLKDSILTWINVPTNLFADTGIYFSIYIAGLAGIFLYDISRSIIIALGDAKCSMLLVITTSILNVVLDLYFICFLHMGVGGAALATILSQIVGMVIALVIMRRKMKPLHLEIALVTEGVKFKSFQFKKIIEILSISIPTILQQSILSFSAILLLTLVNPFGSEIISGYVAVNKIMLFGMLVVIGISQALSIFTASNSGAGQLDRIRDGYRICTIFSTGYLIFVIASNFILPKYLIGAFIDITDNMVAYEFSKNYLQFSCLTYLFSGWKTINESVLRGLMRMKEYLYSNLTDLVVKIVMTYILVSQFSLHGFWMGNMLGKMIALLISAFVLLHGRLLKKNISLNS
jgi:putative MATE family efflux protein